MQVVSERGFSETEQQRAARRAAHGHSVDGEVSTSKLHMIFF